MTRDQHLSEKGLGYGFHAVSQFRELGQAAGVVRGKAVGDGLESEFGKARETRLEVCVKNEGLVDTVDVEEGDSEAGEGKKLGEFEHWVDMPQGWKGKHQNMGLCFFLLHA